MDETLKKIKNYLITEETWIQFGIIVLKVIFILLLTNNCSERLVNRLLNDCL